MATYNQTPGELNLEIGYGDELAITLDFDISLVGYTFDAKVLQANTQVETQMVVSGTNLASGQIGLYLTETQVQSIEGLDNEWYLAWSVAGVTRRALAGTFRIIKFP